MPTGSLKIAWWQTPESNVSVTNSTPLASSRARAAGTSATCRAIGMLFGENVPPNPSFSMTASVRLPAWNSAPGARP